jgi:CheY-like chemotaxis protein
MENDRPYRPVTILLVEDDDGHAELIKDHFRDAGLSSPLLRFQDGEDVLAYLFSDQFRQESTGPVLILLDLRMPKVDGFEVLSRLRTEPTLKHLPVIMLTTTDEPHEVKKCFQLGCNSYLTKPIDFNTFLHALKKVGLYINVVRIENPNNNNIEVR